MGWIPPHKVRDLSRNRLKNTVNASTLPASLTRSNSEPHPKVGVAVEHNGWRYILERWDDQNNWSGRAVSNDNDHYKIVHCTEGSTIEGEYDDGDYIASSSGVLSPEAEHLRLIATS